MLYTLNNNYVLRQELNDCYRLYNKKTLRSYTISYKLFFILEQFRKQSYSLEHLIEEFNVRNIDLSDFYHFIEKDEFFDLLVMANNFKGPFVKYKISKDLSSYTAYSPERVDFLITKPPAVKAPFPAGGRAVRVASEVKVHAPDRKGVGVLAELRRQGRPGVRAGRQGRRPARAGGLRAEGHGRGGGRRGPRPKRLAARKAKRRQNQYE